MLAKEIEIGGRYVAKVSGVLTIVRVDTKRDGYNGRGTHYDVTNERTGRRTTFRSAAKFRRVAPAQ